MKNSKLLIKVIDKNKFIIKKNDTPITMYVTTPALKFLKFMICVFKVVQS